MNARYPELEQSTDAQDGQEVHALAEDIFHGRPHTETDPERIDAAQMYVDALHPDSRLETRLEMPTIHDNCFGTCDSHRFTPGLLEIDDFKFGRGYVDVYRNWQLTAYYEGLRLKYGFDDQRTTVRFRIIQPRCYSAEGPIREWTVKASDLRGAVNTLHSAAHRAEEFKSGPHCKHCPGRHACPAALRAGISLYEAATAPTPEDLTPAQMGTQLAVILRAVAQLDALKVAYTAQVDALARQGKSTPGYTLETKPSTLKWNLPEGQILSMGKLCGVDLRTVCTPTQAMKKLKLDEAAIKLYCKEQQLSTKLVPTNNQAEKVFR